MRYFIAVNIPDRIKEEVSKIQEEFKSLLERACMFKFVEPNNLHLTLKFLGEINDNKVEAVKHNLEKCKNDADTLVPFTSSISGFGVFPSMDFIRVLWFGLKPENNFLQIQNVVDASMAELGFKNEKTFQPHITIARIKNVKDKAKLLNIITKLNKLEIQQKFEVTEIKLKSSMLTREGPIYEDIFTVKI